MLFTRTRVLAPFKFDRLVNLIFIASILATIYVLLPYGSTEKAESKFKAKEQKESLESISEESSRVNSSYPGVEKYVEYTVSRLNLKPLTEIEPLIPSFGTVINNVTSFNYLIEQECRSASTNRITLFIAIISAPGYSDKRRSVRETWLQLFNESPISSHIEVAGHAFVVGNSKNHSVQTESETFKDILQVDFEDSYRNLTLKTVSLLNWLRNKCSVDYVLKVDDDVYVNVMNLASVILSNSETKRAISGLGLTHPPLRHGRWAVGYDVWPWREYPMYIAGAFQLIGGASVSPLVAASQVVPFLSFEDLFLTGLCAEMADVDLMHSKRMLVVKKGKVEEWVALLTSSGSEMYQLHANLTSILTAGCQKSGDIASKGLDDCPVPRLELERYTHKKSP